MLWLLVGKLGLFGTNEDADDPRRMTMSDCTITRLYILAYPVPEHASLLHLVSVQVVS
jgi:hypothetical protein